MNHRGRGREGGRARASKQLKDVMRRVLPSSRAGGGTRLGFQVEFGDHDGDDDKGGVEEEIGCEEIELHAGGLLTALATGQTLGRKRARGEEKLLWSQDNPNRNFPTFRLSIPSTFLSSDSITTYHFHPATAATAATAAAATAPVRA